MRNSSNRGTSRTQKNQRTNRTTKTNSTTTQRTKRTTPKSSTPKSTTTPRTSRTTATTKRTVAKSSQPIMKTKEQWLNGTLNEMTKRTQRSTPKAKSTTPANNSENNYSSVAKNIYRDGSSYRARVSVNGIRSSRNFRTKREAVQWRNEMIAGRA